MHRCTAALTVGFWAMVLLPAVAWGLPAEEARHLLARTGFGVRPMDLASLAPLNRREAVEKLLATVRTSAVSPAPAWVSEPLRKRRRLKQMTEDERKAVRREWRRRGMELKAWWYQEMLATDSPLTERMTLFWHNHFTSSLRKVKSPQLMFRQNRLLREYALGNFRDLLHAISRDPAMMVYLDNHTNRKGKPNENFARELLELFTLGEGHYAEEDIKAAARAFTGWGVDRRTGAFRFRPRQHDRGVKTFLGRTGRWNGDDILEILLDQPSTAEHIVRKLWHQFISRTPGGNEIQSLANLFRRTGYALKPLMAALLSAPAFFNPDNRGTQIKSPVELLVGALRTFELPITNTLVLARAGRHLGQDVFDPPNVRGWTGDKDWISSNTFLLRQDVLQRLLYSREMRRVGGAGSMAPSARSVGMHGRPDAGLTRWLSGLDPAHRSPSDLRLLLLAVDPVNPMPNGVATPDLVATLVRDPAYQLN